MYLLKGQSVRSTRCRLFTEGVNQRHGHNVLRNRANTKAVITFGLSQVTVGFRFDVECEFRQLKRRA